MMGLLAARLLSRVAYERFLWPSEATAPAPTPPEPGWRADGVTESNVGDYPDSGILADLRALLSKGDGGLYARADREVTARVWWQKGPGTVRGRGGLPLFRMQSGDALIHYCETRPAWRGRGIYPWLLQEAVLRLKAPGARIWILSEPDNPASRRGILKAGFQPKGTLEVSACLGILSRRESA